MGLLVYLQNKDRELNKRYLFMSLTISLWSGSLFLWGISTNPPAALLWAKILHIWATFIPVTYFHFIVELLRLTKEKKRILIVGYIVSLLIAFTANTNLFIKGVEDRFLFKLWPVPGVIYPFFLSLFFIYTVYSIYLTSKAFKQSDGFLRQQLKYILLGLIIGFGGGATNYLLFYNIPFIPIGNFFIFFYVILYAYAITRYHLMDIEVLIKKSLVFAGVFAFIFGMVVAVAVLIAQFLGGKNDILTFAISALIITFTLRPIELFLINATDKFLFQKQYEYKQVLQAFIDKEAVLSLDEIVNSTLDILSQTLHPSTAAIFILNKLEDRYQLYNSLGLDNQKIVFTSETKLVNFFRKHHAPAANKQISGISGVNSDIQEELSSLKAVLCLPLLLRDDLIGFISLGKKKSDEEYTKDDLDVLLSLAKTESINVSYAFAVTEVAQSERRAAIGTMSAGINHEIGNPLNIINTKIQIFLAGVGRGLYKDKTKEEVLQECAAILNEAIKQTNRIAEITKKLSNFAKPGKEFRPEIISVAQVIDDTLGVVGHDLKLESIKIVKDISSQPNKILADEHEMEQILFNIIRNAAQAIEDTGSIIIRAFTTADGKVRIEIQDTGKGIAKDKLDRIFKPFFTTKGPSKGTGLGLSIVRELVWKNKGEISFKSEEGKGTTFILEFPKGD